LKHYQRRTAIAAIFALAFVGIGAAALHAELREDEFGTTLQLAPALTIEEAVIDGVLQSLSRVVVLSPKAAEDSDATHAAMLITSEIYHGHISFGGRVPTVKHIRIGSQPNPWECAWLVWNYTDDEHFYYIAIKPTGWELGKRDPAYPGGQRFLASGEGEFPIGVWHSFMITQENDRIAIRLNDVDVASYTDTERPYLQGKLGLYSEDAEVLLDDITAPFAEDFEGYQLLTEKTDGFVMNSWFSPFLGHGFVSIADRSR
jgi:hypothetical protein